MPIYVYEVITEDGEDGDGEDGDGEQFELLQGVDEPVLTEHPETGEPVRRVLSAPNIGGVWSESSMHKSVKDDKKLDKLGFTKYVKSEKGVYEKRAGKGPDIIKRD